MQNKLLIKSFFPIFLRPWFNSNVKKWNKVLCKIYGWSNADHMVLVLVAKQVVDICVICIGAESI